MEKKQKTETISSSTMSYTVGKQASGGYHSISRGGGGGWSFCRSQIIYFNPARRRAENFKYYYMFI